MQKEFSDFWTVYATGSPCLCTPFASLSTYSNHPAVHPSPREPRDVQCHVGRLVGCRIERSPLRQNGVARSRFVPYRREAEKEAKEGGGNLWHK